MPSELTVKRPMMRTAPCAVVCRGDGSHIGAIIDPNKWPHEGGVAGFGDTLPDALRDLAASIEAEVGYTAGEEPSHGMLKAMYLTGIHLRYATDHIWTMQDRPGFIGLRVDCGDAGAIYFTKDQAREVALQMAEYANEPEEPCPVTS